jgi:hypothetical protein
MMLTTAFFANAPGEPSALGGRNTGPTRQAHGRASCGRIAGTKIESQRGPDMRGERLRHASVRLAISTATMPIRKMPSNVFPRSRGGNGRACAQLALCIWPLMLGATRQGFRSVARMTSRIA